MPFSLTGSPRTLCFSSSAVRFIVRFIQSDTFFPSASPSRRKVSSTARRVCSSIEPAARSTPIALRGSKRSATLRPSDAPSTSKMPSMARLRTSGDRLESQCFTVASAK